jgi:uncharacterized protein RhaS with RHS repeats
LHGTALAGHGTSPAGQLTSITETHGTTTLDGTALILNADGQPAKAVTTQNSAAQAPLLYTDNPAGQLTAACQTTATPPACITATGGNETTWSYDKVGNMLTNVFPGTSTTYAYNAAEQLTTATAGTTTTSYGYDPDGDRWFSEIPGPWSYAELTEIHVSRSSDSEILLEIILWSEDAGLSITAKSARLDGEEMVADA